MQRRAAAGYVALFVVIAAAAAYGLWSGRLGGKTNHLWAIAAMSGTTAILMAAMAYMPVRRD